MPCAPWTCTSEQTEINHQNFNKTDNRSANLEWCTPIENVQHARLHNKNRRVPTSQRKKIEMRCKEDSGWGEWFTVDSLNEAQRRYGFDCSNMRRDMIKGRKTKTLPEDGRLYQARKFDNPSQRDLPGEEWREVAVRKTGRGPRGRLLKKRSKVQGSARGLPDLGLAPSLSLSCSNAMFGSSVGLGLGLVQFPRPWSACICIPKQLPSSCFFSLFGSSIFPLCVV